MLKKIKSKVGLLVATAFLAFSMFSNVSAETSSATFQDNFESGNTNSWSKSGGTWSVVTDGTKVLKQSGTSANAYIYTGKTEWSNYSVETRVKPLSYNGSNRYISVLARYSGSSNYYFASIGNNNKLQIGKKVGGASSILASKDYTVANNTWYTVNLDVNDSKLDCYVNGNLELTVTDNSLTSGKIGINTYYASAEFDDVVVLSGSAPVPTPTPPTPTPPTPTPPTPTPPTPTPPTPTPTPTPSVRPGDLFVSQSGDDANTGTSDKPLKTLHYAVSVIQPGYTIYLTGGTHKYSSTVNITRSGTAAQPVTICAAPGVTTKPVLDFSDFKPATENERFYARGITLTGDYWHIKGIEITNSPDNGLKLEGSYNTIEQCIFHHNGDSGLQIGLIKGAKNDGTKVAHNLILNCDSYRNADPATKYENADGFSCKLYPGIGNKFYGCRSWENCDDGWDFYMTNYQIVVENCWAWHNGDPSIWGFSSFNGDGNAFKLGGAGEAAPHLIKNCVAFDSPYGAMCGFNDNNNGMAITLLNCTAWTCGKNFKMTDQPHVLKNCIGFAPVKSKSSNVDLSPSAVQVTNSWNISNITADYSDFVSTSVSDALAPRQADGSLPDNGFAKLKSDSDMIDKGTDVGIPYSGNAPDLGAYEYIGSSTPATPTPTPPTPTPTPSTTPTPVPGSYNLVVAKDGSGNYTSVQTAINAVPANNSSWFNIFIKNGSYKEVVTVDKPFVRLVGESADGTILTYDYCKDTAGSMGGSASVFLKANDFIAQNITFENSFDYDNSKYSNKQAVAAEPMADRQIFLNCRFLGHQDTLYVRSGRQYFKNCYIQGCTDFIYGDATAVFDQCQIHSHSKGSSSCMTAPSTLASTEYGLVFLNCHLTGDSTIKTGYISIGRPWHPSDVKTAMKSSAAYLNCVMDAHCGIWTNMGSVNWKNERFTEYKNTGAGAEIDKSSRPQLTDEAAAKYTVKNILKGTDNWDPETTLQN